MTPAPIPDDVRRFVLIAVTSIPQLEALLLLRSDPVQAWDAAHMAQRLYVAPEVAARVLNELAATGLAARDAGGAWRYGPVDPGLRATIDRLAEVYSRRVADVARLVHSKLEEKAQRFADAFKLRKDS